MVKMKTINWVCCLYVAAQMTAIVQSSHGSFRSCYECAMQSKNYMCDWGQQKGDGLVACCQEGQQSIYC